MKQNGFFIISLFLFLVSAEVTGIPANIRTATIAKAKNVTTLNQFIDVYIREIRLIIKQYNMDPLSTPNITQSFNVGTLNLNHIKAYNLSSLQRTGDVEIFDDQANKNISIGISMGFEELQVYSDYTASTWLVTSVGKVKGKVPEIKMAIRIGIIFNPIHINLVSFHLSKNDKTIELSFYNNYESYIMNLFTSIATKMFSNVIVNLVEGPIKTVIEDVIDNANEALSSLDPTTENHSVKGT